MQQQYISPQTQFSQSVFRVSLLYIIMYFPPIEESITHDIKISLFCLAKKYIIYYYLLLYELQFLEGFLPLRKTVTDRT